MEEKNFFEEFIGSFNNEMKKMGHVNLIIAGKTGVGKSTLINATFREDIAKTGIGTPVTEESDVKWHEKKGFPLRIYDTVGLELDEEKRNRSLETIKKACKDAKKSNDPDRFIHAMWYCIASDSDRLEEYEAEYINSMSEEVDIILVVTKSYRKKHSEKLVKAIETSYRGLKVKSMVSVLAKDETLEDCDEDEIPKKAFGLDTLVEVTAQIVPESAQKAWCNVQKVSVELKVSRSRTLVLTTASLSFGEGFIPLPFSDAFALVPTQVAMLGGITAIFGITVSESLLKSIVTSLIGVAGTTFTGKMIVSNILKMIPGIGTAVGGTISGVTAALLTTALGESYIIIMKMIANGEINEGDLASKEVKEKIRNIFQDNLNKKS